MNAEPDPKRVAVACDLLKATPPSNQYRILVIDDEPANRMILRRLLAAVGYEVIEAENGAAGLAQAVSSKPDLLILDMEMPVLNGAETLTAIRRLPEACGSQVPVIAASGNPTAEMEASALASGADIWMTKPFDFSKLQKAIGSLLTGGRRPETPSRTLARRSSAEPSPVDGLNS